MISRLNSWVESLFECHKLVRRALVVWACYLITYSTYVLYNNLELVTSSVASVHGLTVGLLTTVLALYIKLRNQDDLHKK